MTAVVLAAGEAAPQTPLTLVAALVIAVTALAGVCVYLFKRNDSLNVGIGAERERIATERAGFAQKEESWKATRLLEIEKADKVTEIRLREASEAYGKAVAELHRACRDEVNQLRRENADMIESMSVEHTKANQRNAETWEKLVDRIAQSQVRR